MRPLSSIRSSTVSNGPHCQNKRLSWVQSPCTHVPVPRITVSDVWQHCVQACEETIINGNRTPKLTSQGLTNILWGYATLRYYPDKVLQAVTRELHRRMDSLGQQARPLPTN